MSGKGSTISQFGTDRKNMATFCMAISVEKESQLILYSNNGGLRNTIENKNNY